VQKGPFWELFRKLNCDFSMHFVPVGLCIATDGPKHSSAVQKGENAHVRTLHNTPTKNSASAVYRCSSLRDRNWHLREIC